MVQDCVRGIMSKETENDPCSCRIGSKCKKESPMPTPKHSSLPWGLSIGGDIDDKGGTVIGRFFSYHDGRLILRVVNSHKELVESLAEAADQIEYLQQYLSEKNRRFTEPSSTACKDKAQAILDKLRPKGRNKEAEL